MNAKSAPLPPHIKTMEARYLKHTAKVNNDVKVTLCFENDYVYIHIRDFRFTTFDAAVHYLKEDARSIVKTPLEVI